MASAPALRASRMYAAAQTVLLAAFAAILVWNPGAPLFASQAASRTGSAIAIAGLVVNALGFAALRGNIQVAPHTKPGARLVQSGVYRVLRRRIVAARAYARRGCRRHRGARVPRREAPRGGALPAGRLSGIRAIPRAHD